MNKANKITFSRIIMALIIMVILLFPFDQLGFVFPSYLLFGKVYVNIKYIISGIIFILASITDYFDGKVARKYDIVTDYGKTLDAISDKILTNSLLIVLACNEMISPVIAVVIVVRDIVVDSIKMLVGSKQGAVAAIKVAKWKTATLMLGLTFTLFYNLPFALLGLNITDYLLIVAAILSVISGVSYYQIGKQYLK